jgi:hypothetical protein
LSRPSAGRRRAARVSFEAAGRLDVKKALTLRHREQSTTVALAGTSRARLVLYRIRHRGKNLPAIGLSDSGPSAAALMPWASAAGVVHSCL